MHNKQACFISCYPLLTLSSCSASSFLFLRSSTSSCPFSLPTYCNPPSFQYSSSFLIKVKERPNQLMMMASVFDYLIKYAVNLLKPVRHPHWRSITTAKEAFRTSVDCMLGARDILKELGYSVVTNTSLEFPKNEMEPDREKLCILAAELLLCKLEIERIRSDPRLLQNYHSVSAKLENNFKKESHSASSSPTEMEFFDASDKFPEPNSHDRRHQWHSGEVYPDDTVTQQYDRRHEGASPYFGRVNSSHSGRPDGVNDSRQPLRVFDNSSFRVLRAEQVNNELSEAADEQRRTENYLPMSRDDVFSRSVGVEGRSSTDGYHLDQSERQSFRPPNENRSPPGGNIGTPVLSVNSSTEYYARLPSGHRMASDDNQNLPARSAMPPGSMIPPSESTKSSLDSTTNVTRPPAEIRKPPVRGHVETKDPS